MPLSTEQKHKLLLANNYDPARYELDDATGDVYEREVAQPAASNFQQGPVTKQTPTQTFISQAGAAILPTAAGGLGFAKGAAVGVGLAGRLAAAKAGALAGAGAGPWGAAIGGLAGGVLGGAGASYLASKAQEAIMPERANRYLAEGAQENPKTAMVANVAPFLLGAGGMSPNANAAKAAITLGERGLGMLTKGSRVSVAPEIIAAENANILNTAVNAGLSPAISMAHRAATGGDILPSPGELAYELASGAIYSKPNKLGEAMGFHPLAKQQTPLEKIRADEAQIQAALEKERLAEEASRKVISKETFQVKSALEAAKEQAALERRARKEEEILGKAALREVPPAGPVVNKSAPVVLKPGQKPEIHVPTAEELLIANARKPAEVPAKSPDPVLMTQELEVLRGEQERLLRFQKEKELAIERARLEKLKIDDENLSRLQEDTEGAWIRARQAQEAARLKEAEEASAKLKLAPAEEPNYPVTPEVFQEKVVEAPKGPVQTLGDVTKGKSALAPTVNLGAGELLKAPEIHRPSITPPADWTDPATRGRVNRHKKYSDASEIDARLAELRKTPAEYQAFKNWIRKNFPSLNFEESRQVIEPETGKSKAGVSLGGGNIKISREKGSYDTWPHEAYHELVRRTEGSEDAYLKSLTEKAHKRFGDEEATAQKHLGPEFVGRVFDKNADSLGNRLHDFLAYAKERFGVESEKDLRRLLARELLEGKAEPKNYKRSEGVAKYADQGEFVFRTPEEQEEFDKIVAQIRNADLDADTRRSLEKSLREVRSYPPRPRRIEGERVALETLMRQPERLEGGAKKKYSDEAELPSREDSQLEGFHAQFTEQIKKRADELLKGAPSDVKQGDIVAIEHARFPSRRYEVLGSRGPLKKETEPQVYLRELDTGTNSETAGQEFSIGLSKLKMPEDPKYSDASEISRDDRPFITTLEKELSTNAAKPLGLTPSKRNTVESLQLLNKLKAGNQAEWEMLKQAGIEDYIRGKEHVELDGLRQWIKENGPKVSVHTYGMEGKVSEAKREYDRMTHEWYEQENRLDRSEMDRWWNAYGNEQEMRAEMESRGRDKATIDNAIKYYRLQDIVSAEPRDTSPRATSAYEYVSAWSGKRPEWTTSAKEAIAQGEELPENKQRVDVVIPGGSLERYNELASKAGRSNAEQEELNKIGASRNLWSHDNLHENLPNTLGWAMIQYKTGPKGEKIAVIAEAQSRWAQEKRKYWDTYKTEKERLLNDPAQYGHLDKIEAEKLADKEAHDTARREVHQYRPGMDSPLDKDTNRLILKAAIEQARKEGATHIVVSDAETAMMTEGHDAHVLAPYPEGSIGEYTIVYPNGKPLPDATTGYNFRYDTRAEAEKKAAQLTNWFQEKEPYKVVQITEEMTKPVIDQEPGMRLNYDTILPKIMEDLTGVKGEKVSLGEHKNALDQQPKVTIVKTKLGATDATRIARELTKQTGVEHRSEQIYDSPTEPGGVDNIVKRYDKQPRQNLIFKNPDGSPKTDISGLMYPLDTIGKRLESGEKMTLTGRKYSSDPEIQRTFKALGPDKDLPGFKVKAAELRHRLSAEIPGLAPATETLRNTAGREGGMAADALNEIMNQAREKYGEYSHKILDMMSSMKDDELRMFAAVMLKGDRYHENTTGELSTPAQRELAVEWNRVRKLTFDEAKKANQPVYEYDKDTGEVTPRVREENENYFPQIPSSDALDVLQNHPNSPAAAKYRKAFVEYQERWADLGEAEANKLLDTLIGSFSTTGDIAHEKYNALSKAEGIGLPDEMLEKNPITAMKRYLSRFAKARAFYDVVETSPDLLRVFGRSYDAWGNPVSPVDASLKSLAPNERFARIVEVMQGRTFKASPRIDALSSLANNLILGPVTAASDMVTSFGNMSKFVPSVGNLPGLYAHMLTGVKSGVQSGKETGIVKSSLRDMTEMLQPHERVADMILSWSDGVSRLSGRSGLETLSRGLSQAGAEYLIPLHLKLAEQGNTNSIKLLKGLANNGDYTKLGVQKLASRLVEIGGQGTYDIRGLPLWLIDSQLAPFFKLAKWNVEQTHNFYKHVVLPAAKGENYTPLFATLVGGSIGGYMAKELREFLNNKRTNVPSFAEILAAPDDKQKLPAAAYNYAAAAAYAGYAGLIGDLAKSALDIGHGNRPQGFNYPLAEIAGDYAAHISAAINAITDGEDILKVMPELSKNLFARNIQVGRLANNWMGDSVKREDSEARRDLRVFKQLSGEEQPPQIIPRPDYEGLDAKEFKQTPDLGEAVGMLPQLISRAVEKSGGSPERLKAELRKLKANSYQTMPNPESMPLSFAQYVVYLQKTKGNEEASQVLTNYFQRNAVNKAKSSLIPSF